MSDPTATSGVRIERAVVTDVAELVDQWVRDLRRHRGGLELLASITARGTLSEVLMSAASTNDIWSLNADGQRVGFALIYASVLEAFYVAPEHRRLGIGRQCLLALLQSENAPRDGLALPGDRATKSLYESVGWKARLLTMRGPQ